MKNIEVVAAIILVEDKIFVTQRGYGGFKDMWEFPGGKIKEGESREDALKREIKEELNADIEIEKYLDTIDYDYDTFHLTMHNFICKLKGSYELLEHEAARFVKVNELGTVDFLPADLLILDDLKKYLASR